MSTNPPYFGPGSCLEHRKLFIHMMVERGMVDPLVMDRVRRLVIAEAGRVFSRQQIREWLIDRCIMCDREPWAIRAIEKIADEEAALLDIARRLKQEE